MNPENIYLISDTHFGHIKILEYEDRPFNSIEEMDQSLINNWNNIVHKKGEVYFLGDFSFYNFDKTKTIFDQLKGLKHLVMGNHDRKKTRTWWKRIGFDIIINNPIIFYKEKLILSHEPFKELPKNYKNIHGHTHMKKYKPDGHRFYNKGFADKSSNYINVSADAIKFKPITLKKIINVYSS